MPLYETVFIARQDVSAKQVEDMATSFSKIVNDNGGQTKRIESWGLRTLAYRIKKTARVTTPFSTSTRPSRRSPKWNAT